MLYYGKIAWIIMAKVMVLNGYIEWYAAKPHFLVGIRWVESLWYPSIMVIVQYNRKMFIIVTIILKLLTKYNKNCYCTYMDNWT